MIDPIVTQERNSIKSILKPLVDFYDKKAEKLVYFLYSEGYTVQKVADVLGISKQAAAIKYPKEKRV